MADVLHPRPALADSEGAGRTALSTSSAGRAEEHSAAGGNMSKTQKR